MRRVLFVSITFPPYVDVGTERALRFVRALSCAGIAVDVLTSGSSRIARHDTSSLEPVPRTTRVFDTGLVRPYLPFSAILKIAPRGWHNMIASNLMVPDAFIGWYPFLLNIAQKLFKSNGAAYSAIISTSPPHSAQIAGLRLKKIFNAPWVVDLRDPWAGNPLASFSTPLHKRLQRRLEAMVVSNADAVIASTDKNAQNLKERYPQCEGKIYAINNSYDEDMFGSKPADKPASDAKTLKIFYGGTLHPQYDPESFFKGLSLAMKKHPQMKGSLRLDIYGSKTERKGIARYNLKDTVREHRALSREEFPLRLMESDAALLILNPLDKKQAADFWVPAKLYQYLGARKPVLALAGTGEARDIIEASGIGYICLPSDIPAIASTIIEVFTDWQRGALKRSASASIKPYSTEAQMQRFSDVLSSVL
ncbi:MAG: glycosyltransferase family 4 protein [Deltaproteobacteria bacterium]|nr:glycosyltransferase family 4 protein [Deltaproteobacteria bacterium]